MTPRQHTTLSFIRAYIALYDGVSPSYDEIGAHLGLKAKSGINRIVTGLIERGLLRHEGGKHRALVPVTPASEFERGRRYERELMARERGGSPAAMAVRQ